MAQVVFKLSSNGGTTYLAPGVALADANALAHAASGTYSIKAALDGIYAASTVTWQIVSADDQHIGSLPSVTTNPDNSCSFSVPKTGGAWLLRVVLDGGFNQQTQSADPELTASLAIKVRNSAGLQEIAIGETVEAGPYGYTIAFNEAVRALAGGGAPSGPAGGQLTGTYPNPNIASGVIVNSHVASGAAIDGTKIAADFGSAQDAKARSYQGTAGKGWNGGLSRIDVSAGGTITVGAGNMETRHIEAIGAPASDVRLQFPSAATDGGDSWMVHNKTSDATKALILCETGGTGAGILVPPGASHLVEIAFDQTLQAQDGRGTGFEFQTSISLGAVGTTDTDLMRLPAGYLVTECYAHVKTAPTDGASVVTSSVGVTAGGGELLNGSSPNGGAGTTRGIASSDLGTDMSSNGAVAYSADKTISIRNVVATASGAGGVVVVTITGKRLTL